jgi:hypothetical protein
VPDSWAWGLRDGNTGLPVRGSELLTNRRLAFTRNHAAGAQTRLGLQDPGAVAVFDTLRLSGLPELVVYRNQAVVYAGHWVGMSGGNEVDGSGFVDIVWKDAFGLLDYRLTESPTEDYFAEDATSIAQQLIENNEFNYAPTPMDSSDGLYEPTKIRDRSYQHKVISEAIVELTEVEGGFDWYPTYLDPDTGPQPGRTMLLNIVAHYGSDRPGARFEFGPGTLENCRSYTFTIGLPINTVRALGASSLVSEQTDADSASRYNYFQQVLSATDVAEQATLDDKAMDALRPDPVMITDLKGEPAICPRPWDDFWIGDTIRANIDDGAVQQQLETRVQTVDLALDDSDNVTELIVGVDPGASGSFVAPTNTTRRYVQQQRDLLRRLSALERV